MTIFQKQRSTVYAALQSAKGTAATITAAHAVDPLMESTFCQPKGEQIDRGLMRGTRWPSKQVAGGRWGEGSHVFELRGSGIAGVAPEFSPFLTTLLGTQLTSVADTVEAGTGAVGSFDSSEQFTVGQLVRVAIDTGYEVRRITAVADNGDGTYTNTVQRDFSQAPADDAAISAGVTFLHIGTESPSYMSLDQYLEGLRLLCTDAVCESLNISTNARAVIQGTFGVRSLTCAESALADSMTPVFDDTDPLLGTECSLIFGGSELDMKSLEVSLTTRRSRGGVNSTGYSDLPFAGTFEATATATPWVEDASPIAGFFAGSLVNAEMTKGDTAGNIFHLELIDLQRTGPEIGEDEGDFEWTDPLTITGGVCVGFF